MGDKKISRRKHYEQIAKSGKRKPKELEAALSPDLQYLWLLYVDMHNATGGDISYQELDAYCNRMGELTPFEIEVIRTLNTLFKRSR